MPTQKACFRIDWLGFLWYGPLESGDYKRFEGVDQEYNPIWKARIRDGAEMEPCSYARAAYAVHLFVVDAKQRKR